MLLRLHLCNRTTEWDRSRQVSPPLLQYHDSEKHLLVDKSERVALDSSYQNRMSILHQPNCPLVMTSILRI